MQISQIYSCLQRIAVYPSDIKQRWANDLIKDYYVRQGRVPVAVKSLLVEVLSGLPSFKYNHNHDPENGQFVSGPEDGNSIDDPPIKPVYPIETALTFLLGGESVAAARNALEVSEGAAEQSLNTAQSGLTDHGTERAIERNISDEETRQAIQTAQESGNIITRIGKYGTPQKVYIGQMA